MTDRHLPRPRELRQLLQTRKWSWSPTTRRLSSAASVADIRAIARRRTPRAVFDYTDGGAGDEISIARSLAAFSRVEFRPAVLRDVSTADTSTTILGQRANLPLVLGPTGFTRMMHHSGEPAVARVAARAEVPYALSCVGTTDAGTLAKLVPDARLWFQLYIWRDRSASLELIANARDAGFDALVLTVDTPVGGLRLRDSRNGMSIPPTLSLRTLADGARHPHWWINLMTTAPLEFASMRRFGGTIGELATVMFDPSATFDDVAWLRTVWPGPLVVKGITMPDDAARAVEAGADAIVVSNHGGRQLDRAPTPLECLPVIAARVGDRAEVYLDGGVRSGADIAAAICLGANGVFIARPYLYGLMAGAESGVQKVLDLLRQGLVNTMQLLGAQTISDLGPDTAMLRDR